MIIYSATNKLNKKMYIGMTIRPLQERIKDHYNETIYKQTKFGNALRKYDKDIFEWSIIDQANSVEELSELEIKYIKQFNTYKGEGYNSSPGGNGNFFVTDETKEKLRYEKSQDHREKIAETLRGVKHTDERRHNQSVAHLGKPLSEENKKNISLALTGKPKSPEHIQAVIEARKKYFKKVLCVELNKIYETIALASNEHSIPHANIIKVCQGKRHTAGGYHWQYAEAA